MGVWTYVLCSHVGAQLAELPVTAKHRYQEGAGSTIETRIPLDLPEAVTFYEALSAGVPQLHAFEDGIRRFGGWWTPHVEDSDEATLEAVVTWRSPMRVMAERVLFDAYVTTLAPEAHLAALIGLADSDASYPPIGLRVESMTGSADVSVAWPAGKVLSEAVAELYDNGDGVAIVESFVDPQVEGVLATCTLGAVVEIDVSAEVRFEHGDGTLYNVPMVHREFAKPRTRVVALSNDAPPVPALAEYAAGDRGAYGRWDDVITTEISWFEGDFDGATRIAALASLRRIATLPQTVTFTIDSDAPSAPLPFLDFDVGSVVSLKARREALAIETTGRVRAIELDTDEQMTASAVRVEWGDETSAPIEVLWQRMRERIAAQERR